MIVRLSFICLTSALFLAGCANDHAKASSVEDATVTEHQEVSSPKESRAISEISQEDGIKQQDCEDKFKNEQGICEVPNPEYPKELIEKKYKEKEDNNQFSTRTVKIFDSYQIVSIHTIQTATVLYSMSWRTVV